MAIDGTWYDAAFNTLTLTSSGNSLSGTFAVLSTGVTVPVAGWINGDTDPAVGWTTVGAAGGNDATSWAGQYYADASPPTIIVFWVQQTQPASGAAFPSVGKDFFRQG